MGKVKEREESEEEKEINLSKRRNYREGGLKCALLRDTCNPQGKSVSDMIHLLQYFSQENKKKGSRKSGFLSLGAGLCNHVYTTVYVRR